MMRLTWPPGAVVYGPESQAVEFAWTVAIFLTGGGAGSLTIPPERGGRGLTGVAVLPVDIGWVRRRGATLFAFAALLLFWFQRAEPNWWGVLLVSAGEGLRLWAAGHLRKDETLTTGGPYAFVRNPLYIGSLTIASGLILMLRSLLLLVPLLCGFTLVYRAETRREDKVLRQKFGTAYGQYRQAVPAWIPRLSRYPQASPEPFRWQRVLRNREYNAVLGIVLLFLAADILNDVLAPWLAGERPLGEVLARYLRHLRP